MGISTATIHRGRKEFANAITELPKAISTKKRTGRPPAEKKQPTLEGELERLIANDIAGDPMTDQKWVRASLRSLSRQLNEKGLSTAPMTVRRILKKMGFSLRANFKKKNGVRANYPERDEQFKYIAALKDQFTTRSLPIISVDTKKKELIGNFKKPGRSWRRIADEVNEHDFLSLGVCRAVPYGIYDVNKNLGYVFVGISNDTPRFAVDAIALWWKSEARQQYPNADELLIFADGGGSNGFRSRAWKYQLQTELSSKFGIKISVCHYPSGCSKWNPVEHKLFSFISINWAGQPLRACP